MTAPQLSLAVAEPVKSASVYEHEASAATMVVAGQVMLGGVWSVTVTSNEQLEVRPAPSIAVRVMLCVPRPSEPPAAGDCVTVTGPQLSLAVAAPVKSARV